MKGHTYHNFYEVVRSSYAVHRVTDHRALAMCRTCQEADRDGACDPEGRGCEYACQCHFMVLSEPPCTYTKLCTMDVFRYRPFAFMMHRHFWDHEKPKEKQLSLNLTLTTKQRKAA